MPEFSSPYNVLHVFGQLRRGGPAQALAGIIKHSAGSECTHKVCSLLPADAHTRRQLAAMDAQLVDVSSPAAIDREIAAADIVQVHFWNNPAIHAFIDSNLPDARTVVWCHINGQTAGQVIPRSVVAFGDRIVTTLASTLALPAFNAVPRDCATFIPGGADFTRVDGLATSDHTGFTIGYIGLVDFIKLHPEFVRMSCDVRVPGARFLVCGDGSAHRALSAQIREQRAEGRFAIQAYTEDLRSVLGQLDVFGYPLCRNNSTTSELILQEVMYAGIPPVVLPYGGAASLVQDGQTGIVAADEGAYARAIEMLYHDARLRRRLGENAARDMRERFGAHRTTQQFHALYREMLKEPKRSRLVSTKAVAPSNSQGAWHLVRSLDGVGDEELKLSLSPSDPDAGVWADQRIANFPEIMVEAVLQYRLYYPTDPMLRLWTALVMRQRRRWAVAASEFKASLELGNDTPRTRSYFAESLERAGGGLIRPFTKSAVSTRMNA